jgi:hypothetical protein
MKRGRPARVDYEYERNGTANLFMLFAPLEGTWPNRKISACGQPRNGGSSRPMTLAFIQFVSFRIWPRGATAAR